MIYNEHIPQDIPFRVRNDFSRTSKNRSKIKRHIDRHILNDLNFNIKKKNWKAAHPTIF